MTTTTAPQLRVSDFIADGDAFRREVLDGLLRRRKRLACKFFYDEQGSRLFDRICALPEYYLTRTEMRIMRDHAADMAARIGPACELVEYGSGSSIKTRILLDALQSPGVYVPVDISREHLRRSAEALSHAYPTVEVLPVCADYTRDFELPVPDRSTRQRFVYFPGSTIGNFEPHEAFAFLRRVARVVGSGGGLLIGVDLKKDPTILHAAYNDAAGVTAAFNLNLLARINRELGGDFNLAHFQHYAYYNPGEGRIEMHLVSTAAQSVHIGPTTIRFERGESIHTECSHKYTPEQFAELAEWAGFDVAQVWTDADDLFSVQYLIAR